MATLGTFSQRSWLGVGDLDECWIIATYWALVATGIMRREDLPSIRDFRKAAGRPDKPGPSGGNNDVLMRALRVYAPNADIKNYVGSFEGFKKDLARGYVASLSLLSSQLPAYLQFGFKGAHQVSVYFQGGRFYVMNPLAKEGAPLIQISEKDLRRAAGALFGDNKFHALLIKAGDAKKITKTQALQQPPRDLNAPVVVRDYLHPYEARDFYRARRSKKVDILPD